MPTVARISATPLKSTALQHPDRVHLGPGGVAENRRFFLVDGRDRLLAAPRHPVLFRIAATYDAERDHLAIRFPDGSSIDGTAVAVGDQITVDFWGRPTPGRLVDGDWSAALADCVGSRCGSFAPKRDGGGVDDRPVTLVSRASVRELARRAGVTTSMPGASGSSSRSTAWWPTRRMAGTAGSCASARRSCG